MTKRFQESQRDKLKAYFKEHIYYRVCKEVYEVFRQHNPSVIMTAEDLFADASKTLDSILITRDLDADKCKELWSNAFRRYRELDGIAVGEEVTQAEVAMLCYTVMLGLQAVGFSHYRGTLQRTLHNCVHLMWDKVEKENCASVEAELKSSVNQYTTEMLTWMEQYFVSKESLTKEIELLFTKKAKEDNKGNETELQYYTLLYENVNSSDRTHRLKALQQKWVEWEFISEPNDADDFTNFFSGQKINCHLQWIASNAVLNELLKRLLKGNEFMKKQTKVNATSIMREQFHTGPDRDKSRVDDTAKKRIEFTIYILDPTKTLPMRFTGTRMEKEVEDLSDEAFENSLKQAGLHTMKATHGR